MGIFAAAIVAFVLGIIVAVAVFVLVGVMQYKKMEKLRNESDIPTIPRFDNPKW